MSRDWRVLALGPVTARWRPRTALVTALALLAAAGFAVLSLGSGDFPLAPARVLDVLLGGGTRRERLIVLDLRLPRVVLAAVVGGMLAVSGAITQTVARNALASPDLLGVTAGAGTGAVAVLVLEGSAGGALRAVGVPAAALLGGLLAAGLTAALLTTTGATGLRPLLVGVGVSAFFGGITGWLLLAARVDDVERANAWLAGSLTGRGWTEVGGASLALLLVALALVPLSARIPAVQLGFPVASALGHRAGRVVVALLLCAVVLASVAASAVGPVGFVALVAPHLARLSCAAPRPPLAASAALGAGLLLAADLVARTAFAPITVPAGAVTAVVGAPFLVWSLVRSRRFPS
ncbi:FecCD family ABC transporter permease [Actinosynnema pretiosum]|uniref:Transporter permease n=1 Tax=Actinosynnema pretiosum TaxID=42197 RepID=A0A290ZAF9_9PSEU|nr:iron ABC transporter permease [Actinosynnema pretiosum]ATE55997.1 transporter permease [Actinosynnema pretiosum]